jgi:very-short-patch-repair endonuclease
MLEPEKSMYYGATPVIFQRAFELRRNMTPAEQLLWDKLKGKQILGVRFRRQHPISTYIVDFYCHAAKLVIELDGKIHLAKRESDRKRTNEIEALGIQIIRFDNEDVEKDLDAVVAKITDMINTIINTEK